MKNNDLKPQIGQLAKQQILEDLKSVEAAVFALVSSIENRMRVEALSEEEREEALATNGADFFVVDDKSLMEILCHTCSECFSFLKTNLDEMKIFRELN